jgi:carboxymethylenebutenolidase
VHEIFGVHEHIKDVCRRLAKEGYFAVAPSLFDRQGDVTKLTEQKDVLKVVSKVPDGQVLGDLEATVAWAKTNAVADAGRLGITGFCWGGRIVWLYAAQNAALKAGVAWYGRLTGDKDDLHPRHPIDVAARLAAPVLGLYGAEDQGIPAASVEAMRAALAGGSPAAKRSEIRVYPGAGHAFFADYRPSYRADAAADGWTRMLAWFKGAGVR